jgi:hypothetical protein
VDDRQFFTSRAGRELSPSEVELLFQIDQEATRLKALLEKVSEWNPTAWFEVSNARTDLQSGLMWLRRTASRTTVF